MNHLPPKKDGSIKIEKICFMDDNQPKDWKNFDIYYFGFDKFQPLESKQKFSYPNLTAKLSRNYIPYLEQEKINPTWKNNYPKKLKNIKQIEKIKTNFLNFAPKMKFWKNLFEFEKNENSEGNIYFRGLDSVVGYNGILCIPKQDSQIQIQTKFMIHYAKIFILLLKKIILLFELFLPILVLLGAVFFFISFLLIKLNCFKFSTIEFQNCGVVTNNECVICLDQFEPETEVIKLRNCECNFAYHPECFEQWQKCTVCGQNDKTMTIATLKKCLKCFVYCILTFMYHKETVLAFLEAILSIVKDFE
jgi:hypothetical protein